MDPSLLAWGSAGWGDELARGLLVTLALAACSYAVGLALGAALGVVELGRGVAGRASSLLTAVLRGLPELLVILLVFFGLGPVVARAGAALGLDLGLSPFGAGVVAIGLVMAAYVSEVVKGAVSGVPPGLGEAARALGLRPRSVWRLVTLPLALRLAFPGLANLWMVVIKVTPLVSAIQLEDFIRAAGTAAQSTREFLGFYALTIAVYLALSGASMAAQGAVGRRLARHEEPAGGRGR